MEATINWEEQRQAMQIFQNEKLNLKVRAIRNEDGSISISAEDTAKGFGWTTIATSGNEVIRWARINSYIKEFGFSQKVGKADYIPESLFYMLGMKASNKVAQEFQVWLATDVLPSIRKHGMYAKDELLDNPELLIEVATKLKQERDARLAAEKVIELNRPKVVFADAVTASRTSILVGELAKLLKQNGIDTGQKRLFSWLRNNGYLIRRKGCDYNMPTQRAMEQELFEIKETTITHSDGHISISKTPKVTGKGQQYFINKLLSE